jgi:hypothetical protein
MASFPEAMHFNIKYSDELLDTTKERRERNAQAAIERRRLYRHISNYPVSLLNDIMSNGTITVGEQDEFQRYMYRRSHV